MSYQDFEDAFEELRAPIQKVSGLYSQAGAGVDAAAAINGRPGSLGQPPGSAEVPLWTNEEELLERLNGELPV